MLFFLDAHQVVSRVSPSATWLLLPLEERRCFTVLYRIMQTRAVVLIVSVLSDVLPLSCGREKSNTALEGLLQTVTCGGRKTTTTNTVKFPEQDWFRCSFRY